MKQYRFLLKNVVWIFLLLPLMVGCEKDELKGYEKILGTATINGQNYKESTQWAWNFKGYPSPIRLFENYKLFHFIARLSPEKGENTSYTINCYVSEKDIQFKINHHYEIDFYRDLDVESFFWADVIPYFSENASKILIEGADGIAYVISSTSEEPIPLKGELVLENIDSQTNVCYGHYSFTSSDNDSEKLVINGKFETMTSIINHAY